MEFGTGQFRTQERVSSEDYRGTQRHRLFTFTPNEEVTDIFALPVKQDLVGPHISRHRCYLGEKYAG